MNAGSFAPLIVAQQLSIGFSGSQGHVSLGEGLSFELLAGELVCLLGPNGAGKSTLLRTIVGRQPALSGSVWIMNQPLADLGRLERARAMAVGWTDRIEAGGIRVAELVALGRYPYTGWYGRLCASDHEAVTRAIEFVGIMSLLDRPIGTLSDGERQKVLLARALAQETPILVLDEPTAFIDLPRRVELYLRLRHWAHDRQRTVLLATHDLELALRAADRLFVLSGDGRFHTGLPEELGLAGVFGDWFAGSGAVFDVDTGSIRFPVEKKGQVRLIGDGPLAFWTGRALERIGYPHSDKGSELTVVVTKQDGKPRWEIRQSENIHHADCLGDLVRVLEGGQPG